MKSAQKLKLDKAIFWDADFNELDKSTHHDFIIGRVLALGDISDFQATVRLYGRERMKSVFRATRGMDNKSVNFCQLYFKIKLAWLQVALGAR